MRAFDSNRFIPQNWKIVAAQRTLAPHSSKKCYQLTSKNSLGVMMNAVRVELLFQCQAPAVTFQDVRQISRGSTITLIGKDTPLFRAQLTELLLQHTDVDIIVSPCFCGRTKAYQNPHELVLTAFGIAVPGPLSFNVKDASKRLGVSYSHLRELIRLGRIRKVHGRIASGEIIRYLKEGRNG